MIELYTDRTQLNKKSIDPIPSGIVNALKIRVTFDSSYNDLIKFVVFKCGETTLASMGDTLEYNIPWEILVKQNEGKEILVGVYGSNGTDVILTTNYVSIGKLVRGCDVEDTFSEPPSPSVVQFILDAANQAVNTANEALEVANDEQNIAKQWAGVAEENAQTAGQSQRAAETAQGKAEKARDDAEGYAEQTALDRAATGADRTAVNVALIGFAETTLPGAIQAVEDKADTEIARVGQAGDTQVQAVNAAGAEQIGLATAQADRAEDEADRSETEADKSEQSATIAANNILNGVSTHNSDTDAHQSIQSDIRTVEAALVELDAFANNIATQNNVQEVLENA